MVGCSGGYEWGVHSIDGCGFLWNTSDDSITELGSHVLLVMRSHFEKFERHFLISH